ncbi:hypothetical protein N7453_004987 [Penicillium expansum]|nr:hypothetical protein N7453_004987 [Penicillium expansum]
MFATASILPALGVITLLLQASVVSSYPKTTTYPLTVIDEFTVPLTFENIATRHNGHLIVSSTASPTLYQVSPLEENEAVAIANIPGTTGLLGIAELEQDIFYVVAANVSSTSATPGSNAVWKVDLRGSASCSARKRASSLSATTSLVANITSAQLLNGMCRLEPNNNSILLIADSAAGNVVKLNVETGAYETIIDEKSMKRLETGLQVAVNGIDVHESDLYFTNLNQGVFAKIPIELHNGTATGPTEVIVNNTAGDDFTMSKDGKKAWIAMNGQHSLVEVDVPGKTARVVVDSTYLASASAVSFGRTRLDRDSLYISSAGTLDPTLTRNSTATGGIVVRVDLP